MLPPPPRAHTPRPSRQRLDSPPAEPDTSHPSVATPAVVTSIVEADTGFTTPIAYPPAFANTKVAAPAAATAPRTCLLTLLSLVAAAGLGQ
eukprot:2271888-Pyramimonas_sp.AAC.1